MGREPIRDLREFQPGKMPSLMLWGISRRFHRLYPGHGHVAHALRTLSPVAAISIATHALPLDLHVLSLPLAFILSQDQTLLCIYTFIKFQFDPDSFILIRINALDSKNSRYLLVLIFQYCQRTFCFIQKRAAKVTTFSFSANFS